jgi:hypothetical protein
MTSSRFAGFFNFNGFWKIAPKRLQLGEKLKNGFCRINQNLQNGF